MGNKEKWTEANIPDQTGRVAVVTGANTGLGLETARALAAKGAHVVMACRNEKKAQEAFKNIKSGNPEASLELIPLDLADLSSVRKFAEEFQKEHKTLDLLLNNAGVMALAKRHETKDGFEMQFGTNHLGHFALTGLLLKPLLATKGSRVVSMSSNGHKMGKVNLENLQSQKCYYKWTTYGLSKLSNLLFAYELQRRLKSAGADVISMASHPGWSGTELMRHTPVFGFFNPYFAQTPAMGALPMLRAATEDGVAGGDYYGPDGLGQWRGYPIKVQSNGRSHDLEMAKALFEASVEMTGVTYDELKA